MFLLDIQDFTLISQDQNPLNVIKSRLIMDVGILELLYTNNYLSLLDCLDLIHGNV